jgi:hypothetical protein
VSSVIQAVARCASQFDEHALAHDEIGAVADVNTSALVNQRNDTLSYYG